LSLVRIAEIAAQIADGLAFAHINDVVHRDIKPANIMVLDHDVVKITDFGVALLPAGGHSLDGTTCGSPKYMAPEQITGKKPDGRSDIFSLGTVLYEMLAGRPAFAGDDLSSILYQVLNEAPPLPSTYYPSLPHGFDRIVARAMAKSPEKRYQNAAEMSADLRKYRRYAKLEKKKRLAGSDATSAEKPVGTGEGASFVTPCQWQSACCWRLACYGGI
jgi:serine/threonine-protein kinase